MERDQFEQRQVEIGARLRSFRLRAGLTGRELGRVAMVSQSKISKVECGRLLPSDDDLVRFGAALRLSHAVTDRLRSDVRALSVDRLRQDVAGLAMASGQSTIEEIETKAREVVVVSPLAVPALLQTPHVARTVLAGQELLSEEELDRQVVLRFRRQAQLHDAATTFRFLLFPSSLSFRYGDAEELHLQLQYLLTWTARANVHVRLLDQQRSFPLAIPGAFTLVDRSVVCLETLTTDLFLREEVDVQVYVRAVDRLWEAALDERTTEARIERMMASEDRRSVLLSSGV